MKKSSMQGKSNVEKAEAQYGYWMYADGSSYWGFGVYKGNERPIKITKNCHQEKDTSKKLKWTPEMEEEAEAKKVKEAKEKAEAKGKEEARKAKEKKD